MRSVFLSVIEYIGTSARGMLALIGLGLMFGIVAASQTAPAQNPSNAGGIRSLTATLVIRGEFCGTQTKSGSIIIGGKDTYAVGGQLCPKLEAAMRPLFGALRVVDRAPESPDATGDVVLSPKFGDIGVSMGTGTQLLIGATREMVIVLEWTASNRQGNEIWIQTVKGSARRGTGSSARKEQNARLLADDAIKNVLERSVTAIQGAIELQKIVPAGPPVTAGAPAPTARVPASEVTSLQQVRRIYVEKMPNDLDQHLKTEINKQLAGTLHVVMNIEDADAVLSGTGKKKGGASAVTGRMGLASSATGEITLVSRAGSIELWSGEAGDRGSIITGGMLKRGGFSKVAKRLITDLGKAIEHSK